MGKDVIAAVLNLLPILLIAYVASESTNMSRWKIKGMKRARRDRARRDATWFISVVLVAIVVEIYFLFELNAGDAHGLKAVTLWAAALVWLATLALAVTVSSLPDLSGGKRKLNAGE